MMPLRALLSRRARFFIAQEARSICINRSGLNGLCAGPCPLAADSDDPGQGFQLKAATIPIEGGQQVPVGMFMGSQRR
jgi:hypothetical protein